MGFWLSLSPDSPFLLKLQRCLILLHETIWKTVGLGNPEALNFSVPQEAASVQRASQVPSTAFMRVQNRRR